ncbi:hypothetical protein BV154_009955 [Haemophilus influenzae]|uniref:hypothetical protein n=1 Tax=Haemophilus influenzae TaxID=727 RepID=UPI003D7F6BBB
MKLLNYKGYVGTIEADLENNILFGKLAYIRDLVTYLNAFVTEAIKEKIFREKPSLR